jgi:hypothetical protein
MCEYMRVSVHCMYNPATRCSYEVSVANVSSAAAHARAAQLPALPLRQAARTIHSIGATGPHLRRGAGSQARICTGAD